ncbi:MAG: transposase [Crocinitomicaceae bacterium]
MSYIALGMKRDTALAISGLTKHQYYHIPSGGKPGARPSEQVIRHRNMGLRTINNEVVIRYMKNIQSNDDLKCGHRRMTAQLQLRGCEINHKKVFRLMKLNDLLMEKHKKSPKTYVKYRIIAPLHPLSHLEMDIKFVWVEQHSKHALILSIIDIFTRRILQWHVGMSITRHTVRDVFNAVIIDHLQPADLLTKGVHIEIRNDNDKRFSAKLIQDYFKENHLNQVFTHPYTPEENGHIESFHKTLSTALKGRHFETLEHLEQRLAIFYENYNNRRSHGSLCGLPPYLFTKQWECGNIKRTLLAKNKVKYKLLVPKYQLSGNGSLKGASCSDLKPLNGGENQEMNKANGAIAKQPSVQRSPSVASC